MSTKTNTIICACKPEQKQAWLLSARVSGMSFEEWVCKNLDAAIVETNPQWMAGLSERARVCLLEAGINHPALVADAFLKGVDFSLLNNAGRKIHEEICTWVRAKPLYQLLNATR